MESGGGDGNINGKAEGKKGERTAGSHSQGFNYVCPPRPFVGLQLSCGLQFL